MAEEKAHSLILIFKVHEKYNTTKISLANFIFEESENNKSTDENIGPLAMAKIEKKYSSTIIISLRGIKLTKLSI